MRDADLVTDHALVRYLERVLCLDIEQAKADILAGGRAELVRGIKKGKLKIPEKNVCLFVRGGVVVSVAAIKPPAVAKA